MNPRIVSEVAFDHLALVAQGDDELAHVVVRQVLHDVPQNRPPADFHHRLRLDLGLFREPRAQSARENDCLHGRNFLFAHVRGGVYGEWRIWVNASRRYE